ncbi:MAG: hypothetical protein B7Y41_14315 [Hydrogenophilales bacterium 28-61-23]|nr:MAG: hypothetical protein B7Y41_14315 [Hydrogenophilales bacterium 28-61-23]
MLRTLEAVIDEQGHIKLLESAPLISGQRALVTLLEEEPGEAEWLADASRSPAYAFLNDPAEDIYSLTDGKKYGS